MAQFTRNPDAPLDIGCMDDDPVMGFVMPDGTISTDQGDSAATQ